jgi:hypothetical protein
VDAAADHRMRSTLALRRSFIAFDAQLLSSCLRLRRCLRNRHPDGIDYASSLAWLPDPAHGCSLIGPVHPHTAPRILSAVDVWRNGVVENTRLRYHDAIRLPAPLPQVFSIGCQGMPVFNPLFPVISRQRATTRVGFPYITGAGKSQFPVVKACCI